MLKKLGLICLMGILTSLVPFSAVWSMAGECEEGFVALFNGRDLQGWLGRTDLYEVKDGELCFIEGKKNYGNLMYHRRFRDFVLRFEFQLVPNGNNGLAIRASDIHKDAAYYGMELQILDDTGSLKQNLQPYQYHGSIYGVAAAKKGFLRPVGEWNAQEVRAEGSRITVALNGTVILDVDVAEIHETPDGKEHPGLHNAEGYIGFLGHTMPVKFRNIRICER